MCNSRQVGIQRGCGTGIQTPLIEAPLEISQMWTENYFVLHWYIYAWFFRSQSVSCNLKKRHRTSFWLISISFHGNLCMQHTVLVAFHCVIARCALFPEEKTPTLLVSKINPCMSKYRLWHRELKWHKIKYWCIRRSLW